VETVARARRHFGPMGITRIANVTGLDCIGIPVAMVCRPNARSLSVSQGKGIDHDAARASGVMEAVELYHAERIASPLRLATWNEVRHSLNVVQVEQLPRLSTSKWHADSSLLWIEGKDLIRDKRSWVPYELVHTNYTLPAPTGSGCFVMSSNGLASGNHVLEAINHGLCEVIERDAVTLFYCKSVAAQEATRVDLDTVTDGACRGLLELYERAGVAVGVWDVTSDVGIAAFLCVIVDRVPSPFRRIGPIHGMGCHLVREVALLRALTEAAQGRLTLIAGSRDDTGRAVYAEAHGEDAVQGGRERVLGAGSRPFDETPTRLNDTLEADLATILEGLCGAGIEEAVVVDLSKPEFGISVVRVVVPGLEAYHQIRACLAGRRASAVRAANGRKERQ
jgi:YcaO-like protein with predicted kinase domain